MLPKLLLFFNISGGEILVIVLIAYLVFGPKKLKEIVRNLGKGINDLKKASENIKKEISQEADSIEKDLKETKNSSTELGG